MSTRHLHARRGESRAGDGSDIGPVSGDAGEIGYYHLSSSSLFPIPSDDLFRLVLSIGGDTFGTCLVDATGQPELLCIATCMHSVSLLEVLFGVTGATGPWHRYPPLDDLDGPFGLLSRHWAFLGREKGVADRTEAPTSMFAELLDRGEGDLAEALRRAASSGRRRVNLPAQVEVRGSGAATLLE